jgi:hypothetical protein
MPDQTHATTNQTLRGDEAIEADPGIGSRKMDWNYGIEDKGPGGTVGHPTRPTPPDHALNELIKAVLAGLLRHEWVHHERHAPRTMLVEKSDKWLRRTVCVTARDNNERASPNTHRIARRATAYHIGLLQKAASITSELGYRIAMTTSGDLLRYPHLSSRHEAASRV